MSEQELNNIQSMDLTEFINLSTTVSFYYWNTPAFQTFVSQRRYIKLGTVLPNDVAIVYTSESYMDDIFAELGYDFLSVFPEIYGLTGKAALESAGILRVQERPYLNLTGQGTAIAFIDTGIDYTSPVFKYEDNTTKIKYIWDQSINNNLNINNRNLSEFGVNFGTVYTQEDINQALLSNNPRDVVPHIDTVGHGTFLASIAAGREYGNFIGAAPDSDIIVVKLKKASNYYRKKFLVPDNQEEAYEATDIMLGITFALNQAAKLQKPVVICLGLGSNFGGHNGQNRLENYISFISSTVGVSVCTSAGNESNARHHTDGIIRNTDDVIPIEIRVGDKAKSLSVYIWYSGWDKISFSIKSPTGEIINRIPFFVGTYYEKRLIFEKSLVKILYHQDGSRFAVIQIEDVVPGIWEIRLHGDVVIEGKFHAWLPMTGFISPDIEFVSPTPNYTIVIPSTSLGATVSGAYNDREKSLYINSSWGPTESSKVAPDFVAPGISVSGYYPYGIGTMTGTSVSSAITSGAAALFLQWALVQKNAPATTGNRLRSVLIRGCSREENRDYPNSQWGFGTLNLIEAFNSLRED